MSMGGLRFGILDDQLKDRLLASARAGMPTYDHVGATLGARRWSSPEVRKFSADVGRGPAAFEAAKDALSAWVPHAAIGAHVEPDWPTVEAGTTVLVVLRRGPLYVVAPNRVVGLVEEPRRFAFAFGTLPGHPERGEESFTIEHLEDDTVRATIRVHAKPGTVPARAVAPVVKRLQTAATHRYLQAIEHHVRRP